MGWGKVRTVLPAPPPMCPIDLLAVGLHHHSLDLHARWCAASAEQDGKVKAGLLRSAVLKVHGRVS